MRSLKTCLVSILDCAVTVSSSTSGVVTSFNWDTILFSTYTDLLKMPWLQDTVYDYDYAGTWEAEVQNPISKYETAGLEGIVSLTIICKGRKTCWFIIIIVVIIKTWIDVSPSLLFSALIFFSFGPLEKSSNCGNTTTNSSVARWVRKSIRNFSSCFSACSCSQTIALSHLWEWALGRKTAQESLRKCLCFTLPNNTDPEAFPVSFLLSFGTSLDE